MCIRDSLVEALLDYGAPRNVRDARFQGTPFDWAEHGSRDNRSRPGADYPRVLELLRQA